MPAPKKDDLILVVGQAIQAARKQRGMKAITLAYECGVSAASLSKIENGVHTPRWRVLVAIARALDMPLWQIIRAAELVAWKREMTKKGEAG